jgi:glycosyltransferase involved in cell wall biosynthesis
MRFRNSARGDTLAVSIFVPPPGHGARTSSLRRVLVVAPTPFFGDRGCHIRVLEEVRWLEKLGIAFEIVTYSAGRTPPGVSVTRSARLPGFRIPELGPGLSRPIIDLAVLAAAIPVMRRFRPQVIHAHLHEGIAIGMVLQRLFGVPLLADLQGSLVGELIDHGVLSERGALTWAVRHVERFLVAQPQSVLTSSSPGASLLAAQGVPASRIEHLPDGVDPAQFVPGPADPSLKARLGITSDDVVVFLGVLTRYQGVDMLIQAVPRVLQQRPGAQFLIMGYPDERRYREMAAALGVGHAVIIPGRIPYEEAPAYLRLGQVAVSAKQSLTEANGKLLNYMACGLPVVATDTPVNRGILGDDGVFVRVGHSPGLADAIADLLASPERRRTLAAALRRRAEERFSWSQRILPIYNTLRRLAGEEPAIGYANQSEAAAEML